jgi:hypothetical protein
VQGLPAENALEPEPEGPSRFASDAFGASMVVVASLPPSTTLKLVVPQ